MASRRKRAQKTAEAFEVPAITPESDTLPYNQLDPPADNTREQAHAGPASWDPVDACDFAQTQQGHVNQRVIRSYVIASGLLSSGQFWLWLFVCISFSAAIALGISTVQLTRILASHQRALGILNSTCTRNDVRADPSFMRLEQRSVELAHQLAHLESATATGISSNQIDLLQVSMQHAQESCSKCHTSCLAEATHMFDTAKHEILQDFNQALTTRCQQQLDTSQLLPALVIQHSALAAGQASAVNLHASFLKLPLSSSVHPMATEYLQALVPLPTRCLPLKGSEGYVDLQLPPHAAISSITIHHPWRRTNAPATALRDFSLYQHTKQGLELLGNWTYLAQGAELQRFQLAKQGTQHTLRLQLQSNHGSTGYTCLYSVLFHGQLSPKAVQ